jgi:hypothetical protein
MIADAYWSFIDGNGCRDEIGVLILDWTEGRIGLAENGLKRGVDGLQVYVMCEIP